MGHLQLMAVVFNAPQAAYHQVNLLLFQKVHQQFIKGNHRDVGNVAGGLAHQFQPFFNGKKRRFADVFVYRHHQFLHQTAGALHDVQVAERNGIKGARIGSPVVNGASVFGDAFFHGESHNLYSRSWILP